VRRSRIENFEDVFLNMKLKGDRMIKSFIFATAVMVATSASAEQPAAQPTTVAANVSGSSWDARVNAEMAQCEARLAEVERRLARLEGRL